VREELAELLAAETLANKREEIGDLFYVLAKLASNEGIDPEDALRAANDKFVARFQVMERIARERGWDGFHRRSTDELLSLWNEAKAVTRSLPPS
jgi:uncharacterized protein YabN with tetrapyrrole methylase and pyrophosphatase domain